MGDTTAILDRLVTEFRGLDDAPPLVVRVAAFDAYSLVAALQLALRHPGLSDEQRRIIGTLAWDLASALTALAREWYGDASAIEATLVAGFDPDQDRARL